LLPGQLPAPSGSASASAPAAPPASAGASSKPSASAVPSSSAAAGPSGSPGASGSSAASGSPGPSPSPGTSGTTWKFVKTAQCPDSTFQCITLSVPRDHFTAGGPNWDVAFAIKRATGVKLGTFVTITGGPGYSGVAATDSYSELWDPGIAEHYDLVFADQRGVGLSHPITCPTATGVYYHSEADTGDPAQRDAVGKAASTYVADCMKEANADTADLPFISTAQAIEDLEAFREYLGADKLQLYGESYGTQFVQTYAAKYPKRIAALFIDGPVDLVPDGITYYKEGARAFDDQLIETLAACKAVAACRADTQGGDPLAAYDALAKKLDAGPITFRFPTDKGTFIERQLTRTDLDNSAVGYGYGPLGRSVFIRAVTAASKGSYVPLARVAYDSIVLDPESLIAIPDPTYSDAMYYATECQDYAYYPGAGSTDDRLKAWLDEGQKSGINALRLGATFYGDLPCLYWPAQPKTDPRPAAIVDPPYPTFIMTATTDPATPIANAMRLFGRLPDSYFIEALGGDHVIFGRGDDCPDKLIFSYLLSGTLPATRVTTCPGVVMDEYVPNIRPRANQYPHALALMAAIETEITNTDDYVYRLDKKPITMGCYLGGTLRYQPVKNGTGLVLDHCSFTAGASMSGAGKIDDDAGTFRLAVALGRGDRLAYLDDANGVKSVRGIYRGKRVNLKR
jgi:pimeloyl-ACP methyl ester carboxylesterase